MAFKQIIKDSEVNINTLIEPYRSGINNQADLFYRYRIGSTRQSTRYASGDYIKDTFIDNNKVLTTDKFLKYYRSDYISPALGYLPKFGNLLYSVENNTNQYESLVGQDLNTTLTLHSNSSGQLCIRNVDYNSDITTTLQVYNSNTGSYYTPKIIHLVVQAGGGHRWCR